jgi:hypothetical protein
MQGVAEEASFSEPLQWTDVSIKRAAERIRQRTSMRYAQKKIDQLLSNIGGDHNWLCRL